MILDHIDNWQQYAACHSAFAKAFSHLAETDFTEMDEGRYELDGDRVYVMVQDCEGRGLDGARIEAHRKYIDIQFTVIGEEVIGWADIADTGLAKLVGVKGEGYDAEKDVEFYSGEPFTWIDIPAGHFAVFFPNDGHAPLAADDSFRKVVVKIAVE
jgi:YhcH/YjgK/YiaL family protein